MAQLKCRYCGTTGTLDNLCTRSPTKKHVGVSDGKHCVYCGDLFSNNTCYLSPSKKHQLDR